MHIYMAYVVIFVIVVAVLFIMKKSGKSVPSVFYNQKKVHFRNNPTSYIYD